MHTHTLALNSVANCFGFPAHRDRFRTMINVLGDSIGAGLVYEMSKKELAELDNLEQTGETGNPSGDLALETIESAKM